MDFTHWGQPSEEWLAWEKANPNVMDLNMDISPEEMQTRGNTMRAEVAQKLLTTTGIDKLVKTRDFVVPTRDGQTISIRVYRLKKSYPADETEETSPLPTYVFYHGGGFLYGNIDTESYYCSWLALSLNFTVVHVPYRCTPYYTGFTAWYDALDGFEYCMGNVSSLGIDASRVIVGGISAGGSLAARVTQDEMKRARDTKTATYAEKSRSSKAQAQCMDAPILPKVRADLFERLLGSKADVHDPLWSPGLVKEEELVGTPPTAFIVAGRDLLRDEALMYLQKLKNAGVKTKTHIFPGLPHSFWSVRDLPSAKRYNEVSLESLRWLKKDDGEWEVELPPHPSALKIFTPAQAAPAAGSTEADAAPAIAPEGAKNKV